MSTVIVTIALMASACVVFVLIEAGAAIPWIHRRRQNPVLRLALTWVAIILFACIATKVTESAALFAIVLH